MNKLAVKSISLILIIASSFQFAQGATTTELQKQLQQKQQELDANQSAAQNKATEAKNLSGQINNLNGDIKATEVKIQDNGGQITSTSGQIDELNKKIEQKNQELDALKKKLNAAIVEVYRFSSRSNFDLLLSGTSLGANTNESNYVSAVEIQIKSIHTQVETARKDLQTQKTDLESKQKELTDLRDRQVSYMKGVEYQKSQKDKLLGMTIQQKADYEARVLVIQKEISQVSSELAKKRKSSGGGQFLGGGSNYSADFPSCGGVDPWGFYTCQCTSYAAWYWNVKLGRSWDRGYGPSGTGDAKNWPSLAGYNHVSVHSSPQVGAIISWSGDNI
jgi:peptidoglycan hydrolase CwlO-like protein